MERPDKGIGTELVDTESQVQEKTKAPGSGAFPSSVIEACSIEEIPYAERHGDAGRVEIADLGAAEIMDIRIRRQ